MAQLIVKGFVSSIKNSSNLHALTMTTTNKDKAKEPIEFMHRVPHHQQRFSWDCGVSCVLMLLEDQQRQHFLCYFSDVCREEGFHQSTWTIDLCYLLKRFGIKHTMYTTMPGVNEEYKKHSYYNKILDLDRDRVRRRFAQAAGADVAVVRRALRAGELLAHLRTAGPAILLVDSSRLACGHCKGESLAAQFRRWLGMGGYRGHYILAAGIRGGRVLYRDPARAYRTRGAAGTHAACAVSVGGLRAAHHAAGTDHDAILVHKTYWDNTGSSEHLAS